MGGSAADAICLDDDNDGDGAGDEPPQPLLPAFLPTPPISCWVEAYCAEEKRWLHLDPLNGEFDRPANVEPRLKREWNEHPGKGEVVKVRVGVDRWKEIQDLRSSPLTHRQSP